MAHISIIGTGNMGQAIAAIAGKGGNSVELLGQSDSDKQVTGDVVVLAVPYPAVAAIVATRGPSLAGKVVVDITNPVDFATFDSLTVPPARSPGTSPTRWTSPPSPPSPSRPTARRRPSSPPPSPTRGCSRRSTRPSPAPWRRGPSAR